MSESLTKDDVIKHKKQAIKNIDKLMEHFINKGTDKSLKKANLLSYWFTDFCEYIYREDGYDPTKQINYSRGQVIKANFGFNIGKEYGGLHYAIVLDKCSNHHSHVITVIPLTSGTEKETYKTDVYLGKELYSKLVDKHNSMIDKAQKESDERKKLFDTLRSSLSLLEAKVNKNLSSGATLEDDAPDDLEQQYNNLRKKFELYCIKQKQLTNDIEFLKKSKKEIEKLKIGSIALIGQITTIDKARIYTPRHSTDVLYGISFSEEKMEAINEALKVKFIF